MDKDLERLLNICTAFGIHIQNPRFCTKKLSYIFNIYIIILMVSLLVFLLLAIWRSEIEQGYIISWIVSTVVFISQLLTHFIIMCEALTKHQAHSDFLSLLHEIVAYLKLRLKVDVAKTEMGSELRKTFFIFNVISNVGLTIFAINLILNPDGNYFCYALIAILAIRLRFMQLILYVEILKYFLWSLNRKLNQVVCLKLEKSRQLLDIDYKNLHSLELLKSSKHIYAAIYEASVKLNEFAQGSLFVACVSSFLDCTCHIYWTLLALDSYLPINAIISATSTIIPLTMFIYKFCHTCHILKRECHRTSLFVSRLMCCNPCAMVNKNYKNLVHDFSLQLQHQRIEITGKRFFTFDLECIFAICALILTHLIIIIQFTKSDASQAALNHTNVE